MSHYSRDLVLTAKGPIARKATDMTDLSQRDLSRIPEHKLSAEERQELKRRYDEFIGILRRKSGLLEAVKAPEKKVRPWVPGAVAGKP